MAKPQNTLTYKQDMSKKEAIGILKAVGLPILVFALALYTIQNFANFGSKLLCPLIAAMWIVGFVVGIIMPAQRREIVNAERRECADILQNGTAYVTMYMMYMMV